MSHDFKKIIGKEYIKCASDFVYFMKKYCYIQHPKRGRILFNLYPFQEQILKYFHNDLIINKGRQLGISTLVAGYCLWLMSFHPDKSILVVATKQTTAKNLVTKVKFMYENLPSWLRVKHEEKTKLFLRLTNGSQIQAVASSGDAGRSEALSLLIIDESAFIKNMKTIWTAASSTLAEGGTSIVLSTPNGTGNWFHKTYIDAHEPDDNFTPLKLPWYLHPERDQTWRDGEDIRLGDPRMASQENDCDFTTSGDVVFYGEHRKFYEETYIKEPLEKRGWDTNLWIWQHPDYTREYMVVADPARGDGKDYSGFQVIDIESNTQVAEYKGKMGTTEFGNFLVNIATEYNEALLVIENNSIGWAVVQVAIDRNYRNLYYSPKGEDKSGRPEKYYSKYEDTSKMVPGFTNSARVRPMLVGKMVEYISERGLIFHSSRLLGEMEVFIWLNGKAQAQPGFNDDLVISMGIAMYIRDTALKYRQRGIEITKQALKNMKTTRTQYSGAYNSKTVNNPYLLEIKGSKEDISWLFSK